MATTEPVVQFLRVLPPRATTAYPVSVAGASTPAENIVVWQFDDAGTRYLDFLIALHGYSGGGLTFNIHHMAAAASGDVRIGAAIRRIQDDAEDLDTTAHTYDYNNLTAAVASAIGEVAYDQITFTNGADMDSLLNNEVAILRIRREPGDAADTLGAAWRLLSVTGLES